MNNAFRLICPLCGKPLHQDERRLLCDNRHSFDIARQGYINLLPVQNKHSLHPGDTKEMLLARRRFLDRGFYEPVCQSVVDTLRRYLAVRQPVIADIGCGEGYYTARIRQQCHADCIGIDIAKEGVRMACARDKSILWLAATASHLPLADSSVDAVTALFSLFQPEEYTRILKPGGIVTEVTVGNDHLLELKRMIYDTVFAQDKHPAPCGPHFTELLTEEHRYSVTLQKQELQELLLMTPHFWRIKQENRLKLEQTDALTLTVHYQIRALRKRK